MKKYVFKPYSNNFPALFQKERERIVSGLNIPLVIEHIGSTAVPGLGGKGIVDIGIAIDRKDMGIVSQKLQAIGYEFRPNFSTADRFYFITYLPDPEEGTRRYHIHLTYPENLEWQEFLDFRDYLIAHPETLQEYAQLKQHAVSEAKDEGERYRKIKEPLFRKIQLNVRASNFAAISLYRKMGFEEEGRLKNRVKVKDGYVDDIIMGLDLAKNLECQNDTLIRVMKKSDIETLVNAFCFPWSSIQATAEKWSRYWSENQEGNRTVYLLEREKQIIGYASLLYASEYLNFRNAGIPEINDVWIAEKWRNKGFGKMLIRYIEDSARKIGFEQIGIGVGLYADYGPAQKLYFHLGYSPDGSGVTYKYQPAIPGESYSLDDELILWFTKDL